MQLYSRIVVNLLVILVTILVNLLVKLAKSGSRRFYLGNSGSFRGMLRDVFASVFGTTRRDVSPEGAVASIRCNGAKRERPLEQRHGAKNPGEIEGMSGNDKHSYLIKHSLVLIHIRLALTKQVFSTQSGN